MPAGTPWRYNIPQHMSASQSPMVFILLKSKKWEIFFKVFISSIMIFEISDTNLDPIGYNKTKADHFPAYMD